MRGALRAEWTKLWTSPGTAWSLLGIVAVTVAITVAATGPVTCPLAGCGLDGPRLALTGVQVGQAIVAILAALAIGGEYNTGMVHTTLAAVPRRSAMLAAKAAVVTAVVTAAAVPAVLASLFAGRLLLPQPFTMDGAVLRAAAGSVLYLILIALLSLGLATAVRNPAAAIGIVLGLLYLVPILALAASDEDWQRHLRQAGPMTAGLAVQATAGLDELPIGPWKGLAVLAAWAAGAMLAGALLLRWRDA